MFDLAAVQHSLPVPSSRPLELAQTHSHTCAAEPCSQRTFLRCGGAVIQQWFSSDASPERRTSLALMAKPTDKQRPARKRTTSPRSLRRPSIWAEADSHMAHCVIIMLLERLPSGSSLHTLVSRSTLWSHADELRESGWGEGSFGGGGQFQILSRLI